MHLDTRLYQAVISEFVWDAQLQPNEIGISVRGGVVILTGYTDNYSKKSAAEQIVSRVSGIKLVVNDIQVRPPNSGDYTDVDIACAAVQALEQCTSVPLERVRIVVRTGWVTLEGSVDRYDQCEDAEEAVRELVGLTGVTNMIIVKPAAAPEDVKAWVEEAFQNNPDFDAQLIAVKVCGSKVMLRGQVRSLAERAAAWRIAWHAPGVTSVENQLQVAL
jgi:osmotically-inducible protein OsmY